MQFIFKAHQIASADAWKYMLQSYNTLLIMYYG